MVRSVSLGPSFKFFILFYVFALVFVSLPNTSKAADRVNVYVEVCGDEEWRKKSDWEDEAFDLVEEADEAFIDEFGINLHIDQYTTWDSNDNETDLGDALEEAVHEQLNSEDIIMFFTSQSYSSGGVGVTSYAGADEMIVEDNHNFAFDWDTVRHEVTHVFGVSHSNHPSSTNCILNQNSSTWDNHCEDIIENNKDKYE